MDAQFQFNPKYPQNGEFPAPKFRGAVLPRPYCDAIGLQQLPNQNSLFHYCHIIL